MIRKKIVDRIIEEVVIAVVRVEDTDKLLPIVQAIYNGGISLVEFTMTIPNAFEMIKKIDMEFEGNILLGVGSVLNAKDAELAIRAGAKYVVSPILDTEIINMAHKYDVPGIPGCFTPTEIYNAYKADADLIKIFPANITGMEFIKSVKAPIPNLKLIPTGGVSLTNAKDWLEAGASAVGIGSSLLDKQAIKNNDYEKLRNNAETVMNGLNIRVKNYE